MKNIKFLPLFMLLFAAFNFTSCTQDLEPVDPAIVIPDPTDPTDPTEGEFKATIDGSQYTASTTLVYITGGAIQITAVRPSGDNFGFILDGTATGTYGSVDNILTYNPAGSEFGWWAVNPEDGEQNVGSVIVTEIDTVNQTISGTFSFTGYWSDFEDTSPPAPKQITNGVFTDLPYTTDSPTNDTFFAKVNGVNFNQNNLLTAVISVNEVEVISIGVENANGEAMTVSVSTELGVGSYPITGSLNTDGVQIIYTNAAGQEGTATSGSVSISEVTDDRIKGTFSGNVTIGSTTYSITAGSFDVAY
ncbi:Transferrin-binding protein B C-lobe/N-lobe beta barrel domain-containing protein [Flavobacterium longum]|uniref:DUF6252 family protein n=1 Tax=Flavobacterium longum TaxID=1299340 RepID=UPI0039ED41EF